MQNLFLKDSRLIIMLILSGFFKNTFAEEVRIPVRLNWKSYSNYKVGDRSFPTYVTFDGAQYNKAQSGFLPLYETAVRINGNRNISVRIVNEKYTTIAGGPQDKELLNGKTNAEIQYVTGYERKQIKVLCTLLPLRINSGNYEKLESFDLIIHYDQSLPTQVFGKQGYVSQSVLSSGDWYKIGVTHTGIHSISKSLLKSMGMDIDNIDPRTIKIYGNGPGMVPQWNWVDRIDDLKENAIVINGEADGKFDEGDAIIFYGKSQFDAWQFNSSNNAFEHITNIYSDVTYYYITYGGNPGKRVSNASSPGTPNKNSNSYDYLTVHEQELVNLTKSGRRWMGEEFDRVPSQTFNVNLGTVDLSKPIKFNSVVAAHSFEASSFDVYINGTNVINHSLYKANPGFESSYATNSTEFAPAVSISSSNLSITYNYNQPIPGSIGWLDYFEINARNNLVLNGDQLYFFDRQTVGAGNITQFSVSSSAAPQRVWDVTDPTTPLAINASFNAGTITFNSPTDTLRAFMVDKGTSHFTPDFVQKVPNQNLHSLQPAEFIIVAAESFINEAERIADYHRNNSGFRVHVVPINQIYNEFSSGSQDISAIRDFIRMFYKRATSSQDMPKCVLLFGRASYDYKSRIADNTNFVPTFESVESFNPLSSYCSDDFMGFLDDNEGTWETDSDTYAGELLDIGVGRIPATNASNAADMVNKILGYLMTPDLEDWKNRLAFVADDEDSNIHEDSANELADNARTNFKDYNVQKIYSDAFKEVVTAGGARNPDVQAEIVKAVERGCFIMNYTGHGGEVGWAEERILNTDDIQGWTNGKKLPLFVTATCEFSRYDDPSRFSAGEMVLLNPNGGGIGLFTTVRLVNAFDNDFLNKSFYEYAGLDSTGYLNRRILGEIMRLTKNDNRNPNARNFTLLGDPAMMLAYPKQKVITTAINNVPLSNVPDTMKAYQKITISGIITDHSNSILTNYNGVVYPTVFDKATTYKTVVNNPGPGGSLPFNFDMQNNVIYRGKATVTAGHFTFTFIVPKDISYQLGYGKLSYYAADNGVTDASGYYDGFIVGGTADSIAPDNRGPEIKLYMNDEHFVFGGLTNNNPLFIAKLKDDNGINITGKGIGRDIVATLNNDNTTSQSMNDYFQAKLDSYQEGEVRYKYKSLQPGKNTLKLTAWDAYNNYSESVLDFVVANSEEMALQHVLNYPNPFTTFTTFHFDHNKPGEQITVMVQIFTISGKLIKTLQTETITSGNHFDQISWNGRDDFGDAIGKGVYVYKVKVRSSQGKTAEEYQKLVILN